MTETFAPVPDPEDDTDLLPDPDAVGEEDDDAPVDDGYQGFRPPPVDNDDVIQDLGDDVDDDVEVDA